MRPYRALGRSLSFAVLHLSLRNEVRTFDVPDDEARFEPIPPDEQQLPDHRRRITPEDRAPYWVRD